MTPRQRNFGVALGALLVQSVSGQTNFVGPTQIASIYNLPSSTSLAFPTQTLSPNDTQTWIKKESSWQVSKRGHVTNGEDVSFVQDPLDSSNKEPVFAVRYSQGSYASDSGAEFSTYFNDSSSNGFGTMQLSYQVAFPSNFSFVKGGKLPGLRGGSIDGCSGGSLSTDCFSMRYMWRTNAAGEAYAYIPATKSLCEQNTDLVRCNSDGFGTSLDRGSFTFQTNQWNQVDMVVGLNNPPENPNGFLTVFYNNVLAINRTNLQIRSSSSVAGIQGLFFSTFFGGNDASWASPTDQVTHFRNIQLWGSTALSNLPGAASRTFAPTTGFSLIVGVTAGLLYLNL